MENEYKKTKTTVSKIKYHFIFCTRYRRKIFDIPGVTEETEKLIQQKCAENQIEILHLECKKEYVYICVSTLPSIHIPEIVAYIKTSTSKKIREEFEELSAMTSLWTRKYFVSTEETIDSHTIEWYVGSQKTRS